MYHLFGVAGIVFVALSATNGYSDESQTFTMTAEIIVLDEDLKIVDGTASGQTPEKDVADDSSVPSILVTKTDTDRNGAPIIVELASGTFEGGRVVLQGAISTRTNLLVTVDGVSEKPINLSAGVAPGENLSFVLLDYMSSSREDRLLFVGSSKLVEDSEEKFVISGDLSSINDKDLSFAVAKLEVLSSGTGDGNVVLSSDSVLLQDGKFSFEGMALEPISFAVLVENVERETSHGRRYRGVAYAVVEPGARITISPSKSSSSFSDNFASELLANSQTEDSMHATLVESWQNSSTYLEKMDQYALAIKNKQQLAALESRDESTEEPTDKSDSAENETVEPVDIYREMEEVKNSTLSKIAQNIDKPLLALLAMELRAPEAYQLEMWDRFETTLDQDMFERRVVPRRHALDRQVRLSENAKLVVEGHSAPEFNLANLEGKEIALYDVLAANEIVFVDFWASWCAPCIEQIPTLKQLHSKYKDNGFEIVFVAMTDEYDDWKDESDLHKIPWINVGDLDGGWHAQTAVDYGVQWLPTEFVLDSDGSILDRELSTEELEEILASHFGQELNQEVADELRTFTLKGELVKVGMDLEVVDGSTSDQSQDARTADEGSTSPSVVVTLVNQDIERASERVEVVSGTFSNGKIVLEGSIDERTNVLLSVAYAGEEPVTTRAVAAPGENLSFVLFDYESERIESRLVLVGESRLAQESHTKFTVVGDLSSITDKDLSWATAQVRFQSGKLTNGSVAPTPDTVLLEDGKFLIEGIVDEPMLVNVSVRAPGMLNYWGIADAIVEPGARIRISPRQSSSSFHQSRASDLKANSESDAGLHAELIESWQDSSEFRAKDVEYAEAIRNEQRRSSSDNEENAAELQTEGEESVETKGIDPYDIFKEMEEIKNSVLSSIAQNSDKPMAALLAMELGAPESRQIEMWDKLVVALDPELVERRVSPRRTTRMKQIQLAKNSKIVVQGHLAPEFSLADLEGDEVALSDVLAENEFVLVDFWASWCGPCIAQIPKLKELHSEYKDEGFEIVFVSIDEEYDDWKGESDRQDLPWINVGDLNGWYATTMVDYGVQWVPTEFALNTDGEILKRELSPEDLENLLATHFRPETADGSQTSNEPQTDPSND